MTIRTVCSAISYVVALTIALPGLAATTPADVSGAKPLNQQLAMNTVHKASNLSALAGSTAINIEKVDTRSLDNADYREPTAYDGNYLANFQEALTRKLSLELEERISGSSQ